MKKSAECSATSSTRSHVQLLSKLCLTNITVQDVQFHKSTVSSAQELKVCHIIVCDAELNANKMSRACFISEGFTVSMFSFNRKFHGIFVQTHCVLFMAKTKWKTLCTAQTSLKTVSWRWVLSLTHTFYPLCAIPCGIHPHYFICVVPLILSVSRSMHE